MPGPIVWKAGYLTAILGFIQSNSDGIQTPHVLAVKLDHVLLMTGGKTEQEDVQILSSASTSYSHGRPRIRLSIRVGVLD